MQHISIIENDAIPLARHGAHAIEIVVRTTHVAGLRRIFSVESIDRQGTRISKEVGHFCRRPRGLVKTRPAEARIFKEIENRGLNRVKSVERSHIAVTHALVWPQLPRCKRDHGETAVHLHYSSGIEYAPDVAIEKLDEPRTERRGQKKYARIGIKIDVAKLLPMFLCKLNDLLWIQKCVVDDNARTAVGKPHLLDARLRAKL
jgi:hypothetical protein